MNVPLVFLMGPTASGKTELAVHLGQHLPCEIISVDSAMIYRGMDIGTAKPSTEILRIAPHRLIDICDPAESYSAARFRVDALNEIAKIQAAGKIPLLAGGTGLYYRALEQGLADMPDACQEIRTRLEQEAAQYGWAHLHQRLAKIDPVAAKRIHPNDPQRIQRALEVHELTGIPISTFHSSAGHEPLTGGIIKIIISPDDRSCLHDLIAVRFHKMLDAGLLEEVRALQKRQDLHPRLPSMRLVGYRQVWRYLEGELDYQTMINHAIVATRQLAKRQLTWLRREAGAVRFNSQDPDLAAKLLNYLADKIPMAK